MRHPIVRSLWDAAMSVKRKRAGTPPVVVARHRRRLFALLRVRDRFNIVQCSKAARRYYIAQYGQAAYDRDIR